MIAAILLWIGCVASYLTSNHQKLLSKPLHRQLGWSVFVLTVISSSYLIQQQQHWLSAIILVLCYLMLLWPLIMISQAYLKQRLGQFLMLGTGFSLLLATIGGSHVA